MRQILLVALVAFCACKDMVMFNAFQKFTKTYNKQYKTLEEYTKRFNIFSQNVKKIRHSFEGISKFMDLTEEEFRSNYLKFDKSKLKKVNTKGFKLPKIANPKNDDYKNWFEEGAVNPSKNMGNCDASYAFSALGQMEGFYYETKSEPMVLSAQSIIDCCDYTDERRSYERSRLRLDRKGRQLQI